MIYPVAYLLLAPVIGAWLLTQDPYEGPSWRVPVLHIAWFLCGPQVWAMTVLFNLAEAEL